MDPSGHFAGAMAFGSPFLGKVKVLVEIFSKASLVVSLKNAIPYTYNRIKEYATQSNEIDAQISDMERNNTRTGITTNVPILKNFIRAWNKNCRNEFEDQAKYDQYVDKCEQLQQAKKDAVVDIISNEDLKDAIAEISSDIFNPANYATAYESFQEGEYVDALASLASGIFGDEKNINTTFDAVDDAFDIIAKIAD